MNLKFVKIDENLYYLVDLREDNTVLRFGYLVATSGIDGEKIKTLLMNNGIGVNFKNGEIIPLKEIAKLPMSNKMFIDLIKVIFGEL